jgi:hypothetical protein
MARLVRLANKLPGIASHASCEGNPTRTRDVFGSNYLPAYLEFVPAKYVWADWSDYLFRRSHLSDEADPRLREVTRRLQAKFERRLGTSIAVTRAKDPCAAWRRRNIPERFPTLWIRNFSSVFYWNPKDTLKILASLEELLREEKPMQSTKPRISRSSSSGWFHVKEISASAGKPKRTSTTAGSKAVPEYCETCDRA